MSVIKIEEALEILSGLPDASTPKAIREGVHDAVRAARAELAGLKEAEAKRARESRLFEVRLIGEEVHVDLLYPKHPGTPKFVVVNQSSVRASDGVRLSYDYDEDGFRVEQPTASAVFLPQAGDSGEVHEPDTWTQVFFAQSWALELSDEERDAARDAAFAQQDQHRAALKGKA